MLYSGKLQTTPEMVQRVSRQLIVTVTATPHLYLQLHSTAYKDIARGDSTKESTLTKFTG